jgi:hypothetical protein
LRDDVCAVSNFTWFMWEFIGTPKSHWTPKYQNNFENILYEF